MHSKAEIQIMCVAPELFASAWKAAGPAMLEGLGSAPDTPVLQTMEECKSGLAQWWLIFRDGHLAGSFLTQIKGEGDRKLVHVYAMAGRGVWHLARPIRDKMEEFARAERARRITFFGKPGWPRLIDEAKPTGFCIIQNGQPTNVIEYEGLVP
jgi:hypothetical protein